MHAGWFSSLLQRKERNYEHVRKFSIKLLLSNWVLVEKYYVKNAFHGFQKIWRNKFFENICNNILFKNLLNFFLGSDCPIMYIA